MGASESKPDNESKPAASLPESRKRFFEREKFDVGADAAANSPSSVPRLHLSLLPPTSHHYSPVGKGAYEEVAEQPEVFKASSMRLLKNKVINKQLAAKFIDRKDGKLLSEATEAAVVKHSCLHHLNLVGFREVYKNHEHLVIVMEFIPGSLTLHDKVTASGPMPEALIRPYFRQLVECMSYCHSQEAYHNSLCMDNILLDVRAPRPVLKITDFLYKGSTRSSNDAKLGNAGPSKYTPPEQLVLLVKADGTVSDRGAVDVWAMGVILHVMLTARFPFLDKAQPENVTAKVMRRMALAEFEFSSKPFADQEPSPEIQDLLEKMFQRDPVQRIKAQQILEHPWLQVPEASSSGDAPDPAAAAPMVSKQSEDDIISTVKRARRKRLW